MGSPRRFGVPMRIGWDDVALQGAVQPLGPAAAFLGLVGMTVADEGAVAAGVHGSGRSDAIATQEMGIVNDRAGHPGIPLCGAPDHPECGEAD